jgi:tRNA(fMet)-specific endonuclease VapC
MNRYSSGDFYFAITTFHEQVLGAHNFIRQARHQAGVMRGYGMLQRLLTDYDAAQVLPFDVTAATVFDNLRAQKVRIATMDLRIAAIALANNKTVLTRNTRDFLQVPGLNVEDWTI